MKKLHTFAFSQGPLAGMFKELLASEGIACLIRNERLCGAVGEIPFLECFPELWVIDDETWPRASLLLKGWLAVKKTEEDWLCPQCGEKVESQFELCWNCLHPRD